MSVSNRNSRIHVGIMQAHEKCAMKKKKKQNDSHVKNNRKDFVWPLQKLVVTDVDELQVNNSSHTIKVLFV